jgi:hypothetical protein
MGLQGRDCRAWRTVTPQGVAEPPAWVSFASLMGPPFRQCDGATLGGCGSVGVVRMSGGCGDVKLRGCPAWWVVVRRAGCRRGRRARQSGAWPSWSEAFGEEMAVGAAAFAQVAGVAFGADVDGVDLELPALPVTTATSASPLCGRGRPDRSPVIPDHRRRPHQPTCIKHGPCPATVAAP